MFRITQDPSSGNYIQYLTKITDNDSIVQVCYVRCQCYGGICRWWWIMCDPKHVGAFFKNILNIYWFLRNYDLYNWMQ
jgi:hypothetical protein